MLNDAEDSVTVSSDDFTVIVGKASGALEVFDLGSRELIAAAPRPQLLAGAPRQRHRLPPDLNDMPGPSRGVEDGGPRAVGDLRAGGEARAPGGPHRGRGDPARRGLDLRHDLHRLRQRRRGRRGALHAGRRAAGAAALRDADGGARGSGKHDLVRPGPPRDLLGPQDRRGRGPLLGQGRGPHPRLRPAPGERQPHRRPLGHVHRRRGHGSPRGGRPAPERHRLALHHGGPRGRHPHPRAAAARHDHREPRPRADGRRRRRRMGRPPAPRVHPGVEALRLPLPPPRAHEPGMGSPDEVARQRLPEL